MTQFYSGLSVSDLAMWAGVQAIAVDIDGTLTAGGRIPSEVIAVLSALRRGGLKVCLVTGRPSGWVQGLVTYLPVDAAIAENGGVLFLGPEASPLVRDPSSGDYSEKRSDDLRIPLSGMFSRLLADFPQLQITGDNVYRLSDFTFHVSGLTEQALGQMRQRIEAEGLAFTWSTIHGHIMPRGQEKGSALKRLLAEWGFASHPATTTLTVGDSPNDATMFCAEDFPLSAGVANIVKYREVMNHFPKVVSTFRESEGFIEIMQTLLKIKSDVR